MKNVISLIGYVGWTVVAVLFSLSVVASEGKMDNKDFVITCSKSPTFQSFNVKFIKSPYRYFQVELSYQGSPMGLTQPYDLDHFESGSYVFGFVFKKDPNYWGGVTFMLPSAFQNKSVGIKAFFSDESEPSKAPKVTTTENCKF